MLTVFAACIALTVLSCDQEESTEGPVRIEFWYGLGGKLGEEMGAIIKQFNESQDDVLVVGVQQSRYEETEQNLLAAAAANKVPATALVRSQVLKNYTRLGILETLDQRIAGDPDFHPQDFIPAFLAYCTSDAGETIALPAYGTTQLMYYRHDLFAMAGIDPELALRSWQSLADAAARMTRQENNQVSFYGWELMWGSSNMMDIAYSNGARHVSEDGRTALLDSPAWVDSWEQVRRWIHDDRIFGIHYGGTGWEYWYKTIDDVIQGRAAGYVGSSGDQGDLDFGIISAHIQPGYGNREPAPYADSLNLVLLKGAGQAQKDAGFIWMSYLSSAGITAQFSISTGYIPARSSSADTPEFRAYTATHPQALVPLRQAEIARMTFIDFTGNKIDQALEDACDLVQIENIPAARALAEANRIAQAALDEYWAAADRLP
jgi:multiple sugar transport system substrate-binding protein